MPNVWVSNFPEHEEQDDGNSTRQEQPRGYARRER